MCVVTQEKLVKVARDYFEIEDCKTNLDDPGHFSSFWK